MNRVYSILILVIALCCHSALAEERLKLNKTIILGNGELPKVTFVMPWRDAPSAIPEWMPTPTAQMPTTPLDREQYHLQFEYVRQINQHRGDNRVSNPRNGTLIKNFP
jgi:hypothetical protein